MSTDCRARAWVEVDGAAFRRNVRRIREAVGPDVAIVPMVKADAYGLGVRDAVRFLALEGPWGYGVATVTEGLELRALGVDAPVLVCSPAPPDMVPAAVEGRLTLSISDVASLERLERAAEEQGREAPFHVEVDTGMGRAGFPWREAGEWAPVLARTAHRARWAGVYTHFHSADERGDGSALQQWERLQEVVLGVDAIPDDIFLHAANSAGIFRAPDVHGQGVRPGIFLYGGRPGADLPPPEPVAHVRARVVRVQEVPAGTTVGYGATYVASRPETWATLAIGYGDGLPRVLGNRGRALLRNRRVPIIGRISMDVTVVDITDLEASGLAEPVRPGDVATLLGGDGDDCIELEEVADQAGTINYEILTGLTPRLPRVWTGAGPDGG